MKTLIILSSFSASFFVRALRWLSIAQQKEYRFDRLMLFIKTAEGKEELLKLIPKKKDFSRMGLKRPKITSRILIISVIFAFLSSFLITCLIIKTFALGSLIFILYLLVGLFIYLLLIPFLVMISILPTTLIASIRIYLELVRARTKVKKSNPIIIGITGSYGKTSTKMLLAKVLEKKYSVFKTPKSYNTRFSVAKSISKGFKNQEMMIIEYGAYKKGEIKSLAKWFKPNLAVITGLAKQHLGLFGSLKSLKIAKAELVRSLDSGSVVICNGSDQGAIEICELGSGGKMNADLKIIEASNKNKDSLIIKAHLNKAGKLLFVWNGQQVSTNLMGMHYLEIIRMVILVAKNFDLKNQDIVEAISEFVPDEKFIYSYKSKKGNLIIDDGGTSNPKGFEAAINLASQIDASKKVLITSGIVDLGIESEEIHQKLAQKSKQVFDTVLYVGKSGKKQFENIFENNFVGTQEKVIDFLSKIDKDEMILIEGKMPGWISEYLR